MKKIIAYPLTIIFYLFYGLLLLIFHPIQWIALKLGGYNLHKKVVSILNLGLVRCLHFLGTKIKFINKQTIPENAPLIIVSNHQSMNDIPAIIWFMRKYHPKFVSKKELGKGIPSVSFNLRHGGSALIDRKNPKQAIEELARFGKYIEKNKFAAVIFPEGTRSRDGIPKRFSSNGMKTLVKKIPSAYIVPLTINNSWKLLKYGGFPMNIGVDLIFEVHKPIQASSLKFEELFEKVEKTIKNSVIS
ncbi:lysophospholipid acyltransferase family protein [Urechidicola croceus]|uniref:1-acyl-sn-glycerol-3-phosphate acyltransferase n=1 Tax=Urechidicola croceus TaxID=1850246 RepID=A0A1D8PC03_9FLAO|nr:lysophospholipid acyltransferase family protein [Urechidicola croceus]AOW22103.1 1-acyl-sn-glycerol-3-phosphate acyltransferase [Urechidicola croceus]